MHQNMKFHSFRNSGTLAREWRGKVALLAKANKPQPRTLQFPLDLADEQKAALPFDDLARIYNTIEGTGSGSLFDYWAALHLAGIRFFGSNSAAATFRLASVFQDDTWNESFRSQSGHDWNWFIPSGLIGRFLSQPRAVGGKDITFDAAGIANEFHKFLVGPSITEKTPTDQAAFLKEMGEAIAAIATDWKKAGEDIPSAMKAVDGFLKTRGLSLPSLENIAKIYGAAPECKMPLAYAGDFTSQARTIHAVFAKCARNYGKPADAKISSHVQEEAVTANANALSWVFGNGIEYFRSTPVEKIITDLEYPSDRSGHMQSVVDAARNIPQCTLFGETHYGKFRTVFASKVNSWIANYANRLNELRVLIDAIEEGFTLPEALAKDKARDFLSGMDINLDQLNDLLAAVRVGKEDAASALSVLMGEADGDVAKTVQRIETFSEYVDNAYGRLQMLKNRINKEREIAEFTRDDLRLAFALECAFEIPKWLAPMPALNNLTGGVPDFRQEREATIDRFNRTRLAMENHHAKITEWCAGKDIQPDPYARIAEREAQHLKRLNPKLTEVRGDRRARRNILNRILRVVQKLSEPTRQALAADIRKMGVFEKESDANRLIFEQKGAVYRGVFDNSRHQLYKLVDLVLMETDWLDVLDGWRKWLHGSLVEGAQDPRQIEDWLTLDKAWYAIHLSGLPDVEYPSSVAAPLLDDLNLPLPMRIQLARPVQTAETLQKVFNQYASVLSGAAFMLFRRRFSLKMRFMLTGENDFLYAPKQKQWRIPSQYATSEGMIGVAIRKLDQEIVEPEQAVNALITGKCGAAALGEFMRQSPHDWYFQSGLPIDQPVRAVVVGKDSIKKGFNKSGNRYGIRLIGAPAYKSVLNRQLTGEATCGDMTLIVEMHYEQNTMMSDNGIHVEARYVDNRLLISAPMTETRTLQPMEAEEMFGRIVAIDLGEVGVGYAVFDARTMQKIDSGFKRIPSIRRMMQRTRHYEDRPSFRQKFQAAFNVNMSELRENVVGDVCHQINRLCAFYKGFPVIESMTGGTGNRQLDSVYDTVGHLYCYSGTQAHQMARKQYWMGAETWQHPFLLAPEYKDGKVAEGKSKPLNLFPGSGVGSKGNSQECSCCHRNPIELLANFKESERLPVFNGRLKVGNETLMLFEKVRVSRDEWEKIRQSRRRVPMERPLPAGEYTVSELRRIIKLNIRRAPEHQQSTDTTKSRYHCAFADCGNTMHADENAAINIGRKFFLTKVAKALAE